MYSYLIIFSKALLQFLFKQIQWRWFRISFHRWALKSYIELKKSVGLTLNHVEFVNATYVDYCGVVACKTWFECKTCLTRIICGSVFYLERHTVLKRPEAQFYPSFWLVLNFPVNIRLCNNTVDALWVVTKFTHLFAVLYLLGWDVHIHGILRGRYYIRCSQAWSSRINDQSLYIPDSRCCECTSW